MRKKPFIFQSNVLSIQKNSIPAEKPSEQLSMYSAVIKHFYAVILEFPALLSLSRCAADRFFGRYSHVFF